MSTASDPESAARIARAAARRAARERQTDASPPRPLAAPTSQFSTSWGRLLVVAVAALALLTLLGLGLLWPGGQKNTPSQSQAMGGKTLGATVLSEATVGCAGPTRQACRRVTVRLNGGARAAMTTGPVASTAALEKGAKIRVQRVQEPPGARNVEPYAFAGYDRRGTLLWAALIFAVLVVVITRIRGLLALAGLALSLLIVTKFVVPALLAGESGLLVALVGALTVMFVTVGLTYGVTRPSLAACLGIGVTLLIAATSAKVFAHAAHLDGRSSELSTFLTGLDARLSLTGVVLAGMVLATLGVLADMGVTQASAVMALRHADPRSSARQLYRRGFGVGRDHLVATTHTLVLVYVGATLPLLLVMSAAGVGTTDALNTQDLAEPILGTLIGAMALLISVPVTTALTAAVVAQMPPESFGAVHVHAH
jgi:uncharacterized membrane protein